MTVIVDTNVILVANRQHDDVSEACIRTCAKRLQAIVAGDRIAIDDGYRILKEYQNKTMPQVGKRAGDVFVKWVLRNNANDERCARVRIVERSDRGFESFPDDERLASFDTADRKFVAVACAHGDHPPIAQAADSKWLDWATALQDHGVFVEFLCRADVQRFDDRKKKSKKRRNGTAT
jgi:hypothetical protein